MIEVIDRVPTYPGRVKLTPVSGQTNVYDMVRADEPLVVGTPLNKALFNSIGDELATLTQNVSNLVAAHASLNPIGNIAGGTEIGIYENGVLVPYIKVTGDYEQTGRSALMRKHIFKMDTVTAVNNDYINSKCDVWLNNEFLGMLDSNTRAAIAEVAIPYFTTNDSTRKTAYRKVFLASRVECGGSSDNVDGTPFPYFNSNARRIALYNGTPVEWWTRSANASATTWLSMVATGGFFASGFPYQDKYGIRPVFTLPHDFEVTVATPGTNNVMAAAEVI